MHNLRLLMDEIFGEENFVAQIVWQKKYAVSNDDPSIGVMHDYIVAYRRSERFQRGLLPRTEKQLSRYTNEDNDPRGAWSSDNYVSNKSREERPTLWYPIKHPKTGEDVWPDEHAVWRYAPETHARMVAENRLYWGPSDSYRKPRLKRFLNEIQEGTVPSTWWEFEEAGHNDEASKETGEILGRKVFDTPKPARLLKRILTVGCGKNDLILDFFAGSGTTAQAVLELNLEDGGNRKFILVQLPEPTGRDDFPTIAEITKERVRRVIRRIEKERAGQLELSSGAPSVDLGFKVFKLAASNFSVWDPALAPTQPDQLAAQWQLTADNVRADAQEQALLYELMLKCGLPLSSPVETADAAGSIAYRLDEGRLVICLAREVTQEALRAMIALQPQSLLCLDIGFKGNDALKVNAQLECQSHGIQFRTA
jgi:adenine-specific DNA-methyltransferase